MNETSDSILRQVALKAAVELHKDGVVALETILDQAQIMHDWLKKPYVKEQPKVENGILV